MQTCPGKERQSSSSKMLEDYKKKARQQAKKIIKEIS